jgi:hypothetical protein
MLMGSYPTKHYHASVQATVNNSYIFQIIIKQLKSVFVKSVYLSRHVFKQDLSQENWSSHTNDISFINPIECWLHTVTRNITFCHLASLLRTSSVMHKTNTQVTNSIQLIRQYTYVWSTTEDKLTCWYSVVKWSNKTFPQCGLRANEFFGIVFLCKGEAVYPWTTSLTFRPIQVSGYCIISAHCIRFIAVFNYTSCLCRSDSSVCSQLLWEFRTPSDGGCVMYQWKQRPSPAVPTNLATVHHATILALNLIWKPLSMSAFSFMLTEEILN